MSNTVVKDFPPATKSADNALVIVVGEDGSLSVDPETLNNLLNKGSQNTEVSIVRMSGTSTENDEVDATLETFLETTNNIGTHNIDTTDILEPPQTNHKKMEELTVDIDEISRMCRNIQMDHCYTPLTSPGQKLETINKNNSDLLQSQTLNKSTEDLMAVLEADNEPVSKPPTSISKPVTSLLAPVDTTSQLLAQLEKSKDTNSASQVVTKPPVIKTTPCSVGLVQSVPKPISGGALSSTPIKKTLKIVTVTKPATGIRVATTATPPLMPQTSTPIKEPTKEPPVQKLPVKEKECKIVKEPSQTSVSNDSKLEEDLSDISSDSDFEMDDDSEDSDFDAGKQKISKPKYKTFGSKRNKSGANRKRDKSANKSLNRSLGKPKKIQQNKDPTKPPLVIKTNKIVRTKSKTNLVQEESSTPITPVTPVTPVTPTTPQQEVVSPQTDKHDQSKKLPKKKVPKPIGLFDDGIALFSTPDVIRRVSVSGDSPTKVTEPNIKPRTQSVDQKVEDRIEGSNKTKDDLSKIDLKPDKAPITSEVDSTTPMDATEQTLAGLDNANLDLDLNADELIPEDLLFQVAKLVENADIQKVIDTNLTLVDQNLDNLDSVLPKTNDDSFVQKEVENMNVTENTQDVIPNETHTKLQQKPQNKIQTPLSSTAQAPAGNLITKNNTNKPIQIVRPDGRVIIIPPIEKPATRSSKRKQGGDNNTSATQLTSDSDTNSVTAPPSTLQNTSVISTAEHEKSKQNTDNSRSEQLQSNTNAADDSDISDSDESWKSEDDPDRLWCICKQPHNNRFMICCDTCEEWFHGQCVGVSKALGRQMEQQGKEWQCPNCQKVKKNALQQALNEAQQATMDLLSPTAPTTTPQQNTVQSSEDADKPVQRCIVCKGPSRSGSVYCSESCIVQHSNAVERVIVFERATGRCLSGNNAPTVANLKQWLKQHPGFEVVSSGNKTLTQSKLQLNKTGVNKNSQQNLKIQGKQTPGSNKQAPHILNHQLGKGLLQKSQQSFYGKPNSQTPNKQLPNTATTTPVKNQQAKMVTSTPLAQVKGVKIIQPHTLTIKTPPIKQKTIPPTTPTTPQTPKQTPPQEEEKPIVKKKTPNSNAKSTTTPQKVSRQKSVSSVTEDNRQQKGPEQLRGNVRKTLAEHLLLRLKEQEEIKMSEESVKKLSDEIEAELYSLFNKDTGAKYRNRYRSLIFNIKDPKNETLWKRICQKAVSPKQLVRLLPEELASQELAQWRERETKHQLDMIKKTELDLLSCVRTYVLKSHKGEEVIEKRVDAVDSTIVADLDGSLNNEERIADSTTERPRSQDSSSKDTSKSKSSDHKHRRESSSSHHKSSRDRSSRKHRDGSHDRKRRSRSKDRRRDGSKDRRSSDSKKSRHRSRSGSRHKSTDHDKSRHKDKHDHKNKSSSKHKHNNSSRHKDSESDSTTSSNTTKNSTRDLSKSDTTDLLTMGLDKKSKEILESLVDNKVVDNRILRDEILAPISTVTADSESDHEPSSTVTIATPPRSADIDSTPIDKQSRTSVDTATEEPPTPELSESSENIEKKIISAPTKTISTQPTSADGPVIWKGFINMIDVAKFRITAQEVSGDCISLAKELSTSLDIVGRISPDTVWEYLSKMRRSTAKYISILRLMPENSDEQSAYQSLYTYLSSRKRFGVVKTANTSIKDFYIMPQASYNPLPQVLLPISGPGFEESRPNLLLGILVSSKRKRPQIYETNATILAKKMKESSPPRSYTPPPSDIKDPRTGPPKTNLISSIVMPPLPTVAPIPPPEITKPEPPPLDDMDEPYSPGDSDDTLPTIPVNIIKTKSTTVREKEKILLPPLPPVTKPVASDLSILEPFKTSNYPTIPGLDAAPAAPSESSTTSSLDVLNLLSSTISSTSVINLDASPVSTQSLSAEISASTGLDALAIQRNIDEINKRIERERQEIDSISMGIVQKKDIESSCLANIALPSNLQQILDSIKTKKCDETDILPKDKEETSPIEEYTPVTNTLSSTSIPSYAPSSSTTKEPTPVLDDDEPLPTIPLLLPKLPRPSLESKTNISDLNIPLNLPISKRVLPSSSIKRSANDSDLLTDAKRKHLDTSGELPQIPLNLPLVSKKSFSHHTSTSPSKMTVESSQTKPSSVLSSLSTEELIRKANEMLAAQDDKVEDEDDDESFDSSTESPIKQAPVLYPNTSIPPPTMRFMEQPPVPGLEDYE